MNRRSPRTAFTLIEMLVVMAVIAILTGIILSLNGLIQNTAARSRAASEIRALSAACEAYKADNGGYPQGSPAPQSSSGSGPAATDTLDPNPATSGAFSTFTASPNNSAYYAASLFLYQQLSGHLNDSSRTTLPTGTNYAGDFFKPAVLNVQNNQVYYIMDPFGNSYGYSTAGLYADQLYRQQVLQNGSGTRTIAGFNPTFDLWSTGGSTSGVTAKWVKNW